MLATMHHLMGAAEIGIRLGGLSRQRVQQIISRPDFPKPTHELQMGKVWDTEDVETWIQEHRPDLAEAPERPAEPPRVRKGRRDPNRPRHPRPGAGT